MAKLLFAIMDGDGEFVVGGSSNAKRNSKKPHAYTSHGRAKLGLKHVEGKAEELEIVPFVSMDDFMGVALAFAEVLPYIGDDRNVDNFLAIMEKYDYVLYEDAGLVHRSEVPK